MKHKKNSAIPTSQKVHYQKIRNLPLGKCYISTEWQDQGLITVVVSRNHINGNFTCGIFLVDLYCLGVKETLLVYNENHSYHETLRVLNEEEGIEECTYSLAHNIIYGAIAYAEDLGFKPSNEFDTTQYVLEEDDDRVEFMDIKFGLSGKPAIYLEVVKNPGRIITTLEKSVGPDGYIIIDR